MHEAVDVWVREQGGGRWEGEVDIQHIALVRAPTNAQGSGSKMLVSVCRVGIITHTFGVWLTEDIKLAGDTVDEGLIDRFKETVGVWVRLDNFDR
jgi:hypothetical protein